MNRRKLLLLTTVTLLLAYQSAWAQYGPTTASQVQALAALGALTGKGVPLVPAAAPGSYRPHLWVAGQLNDTSKALGRWHKLHCPASATKARMAVLFYAPMPYRSRTKSPTSTTRTAEPA